MVEGKLQEGQFWLLPGYMVADGEPGYPGPTVSTKM